MSIVLQIRSMLAAGMSIEDALTAAEAIEKSGKPKTKSVARRDAQSTRLPADWWPDEELKAFALNELAGNKAMARRETEAFRDYWIAQPGEKGRKLDWNATYRNWVRKAAARGGYVNTSQGAKPSVSRTDDAFTNLIDRLGR